MSSSAINCGESIANTAMPASNSDATYDANDDGIIKKAAEPAKTSAITAPASTKGLYMWF